MRITFPGVVSPKMRFVAGVTVADRYDLVVIGGGSAGLTAADFGSRIGGNILIAAEELGGDCTWTGCIPSKTLIRLARVGHDRPIDFARVMTEVRAVIARVYSYETPEALTKRGVEVAIGPVRFVDGVTIQAGERRISARHFVVCTGAEPKIPPIRGLQSVPYLTYESIFDLSHLPARLIIVGAGATGVELAQAFARLGSGVTLVEQGSALLPGADQEAVAIVRRRLDADGIKVLTSAEVTGVATENGRVVVETAAAPLDGDALLLATGRTPRTGGLDLERAGIEVREGAIRVDKNLRTTNPNVYAAGDVTGGFQFTHYAGWQGYVAARNALLPGAQEGVRSSVPWAVFTDPEVAQAGLTEAEARSKLRDVKVHRLPLDRVDRAETEGTTDGFLKLVSDAGGKLLGATVVSRAAGETINELSLAIDRGLSVSDLASAMHVYPTFGFAVQQLAAEASFEAATTGTKGRVTRALRHLN